MVSLVLAVISFSITSRLMLYVPGMPNAWLHFLGCGMVGIVSAYAFVWIAQYYTDYKYKPVRLVAEASTTGTCVSLTFVRTDHCQSLSRISVGDAAHRGDER